MTKKISLVGKQKLELVPARWPLARLSFSPQKCMDILDRVLASCWEVHATRVTPLNHYLPSQSGEMSDYAARCVFG